MIKRLLLIVFLMQTTTSAVLGEEKKRHPASVEPYEKMQLLSGMAGRWHMQSEYTEDGGITWQKAPKSPIVVRYRQKDLLLEEIPTNPDLPTFHVMHWLSYDQYRDVYRLAAMDDIWGLLDIYEGTINNGKLVVNNIKAETFFPMGDGKNRMFTLSMELSGDTRITDITASDDGGATWQPSFRLTYERRQ